MTMIGIRYDLRVPPFGSATHAELYAACLEQCTWADAHGVDILRRAGYDGKQVMANTLSWLLQTSGPSGGFLATHPATEDRIQRVRN